MNFKKTFWLALISCVMLNFNLNAQPVALEPILSEVIVNPSNSLDTMYVAKIKVSLSDSISVFANRIRLVVIEGSNLLKDVDYSVSEISSQINDTVWKESLSIYFSIPNYSPLRPRRYLVELLDGLGQMRYQYEIEL